MSSALYHERFLYSLPLLGYVYLNGPRLLPSTQSSRRVFGAWRIQESFAIYFLRHRQVVPHLPGEGIQILLDFTPPPPSFSLSSSSSTASYRQQWALPDLSSSRAKWDHSIFDSFPWIWHVLASFLVELRTISYLSNLHDCAAGAIQPLASRTWPTISNARKVAAHP